jgi:Subtilase family
MKSTAIAILFVMCLEAATHAQIHHLPPKPTIAPFISMRYPNDANGDRVDDALFARAAQALTANKSPVETKENQYAEAALDQKIAVELIFKERITQQQIDTFLAFGAEITYVYKSVSYGWNGRIALKHIPALPAVMGSSLVLVDGPQETAPAVYEATRTGRVRPIWAPGFAGSVSGFSGDTNITIAFLDSGVDGTHTDLAGRGIYVSNFTDEPFPSFGDVGHGTHTAGVALGSGAASGSASSTLKLTFSDNLSGLSNNLFYTGNGPALINLPTNSVTTSGTFRWNGGNSRIYWASHIDGANPGSWNPVGFINGASPLTFSITSNGLTNRSYAPVLVQSNSITDFVVSYQITSYPGLGDGFNKLRGVAPGCNWADARTTRSTGTGQVSFTTAALDDLVAKRIEKNIKVINISATVFGDPGKNASLRQKVNSTVNNGILVVTACGNHGYASGAENFREISDPGRAALALSLGAANDINQLTDFTSHGFDPALDQGEDHKPDLLAPGGSAWRGTYITSADNNANDTPLAPHDAPFPDQQANDYESFHGTSRAAAFTAGCAALVIDAMQKRGIVWDFYSGRHALFVKMLLCATASESGLAREGGGGFDPTVERDTPGPNGYPIGKDPYEGYGMINPDAAVEAVSLTYTNGTTNSATFGDNPNDRRCWARAVNLLAGQLFAANLEVPDGCNFDLYLYSGQPGSNGAPVILASSAQWIYGGTEALTYAPATNTAALLVIKRISGSGSFNVSATELLAPAITIGPSDPVNFIFSFPSISGRTYLVQYKDSLDDPAWQSLQFITGDGTVKTVTDPLSPNQRLYRLAMQ